MTLGMMNQLCKVCGEPAAGYHFGAFTCEGCKSFFGRTYNNLAALGECKNSGQCVINKKNRTSCKSCRLKKCLMVGMSKSGSRYGRRSNWFKIHCLIQDQAEMNSRIAEQHTALREGQLSGLYDKQDVLSHRYKSPEMRETNGDGSSPLSTSDSGKATSPFPTTPFEASKSSPVQNGYTTVDSPPFERKDSNFAAFHPLSPVSPISPLHPSKFFFHPGAGVFFGKPSNGMPKLYGDGIGYPYSPRFLPLSPSNSGIVKPQREAVPPLAVECFGDLPEQDKPIDLSVKKSPSPPTVLPMVEDDEEDVKPHTRTPSPCAPTAEIPLDLTKRC